MSIQLSGHMSHIPSVNVCHTFLSFTICQCLSVCLLPVWILAASVSSLFILHLWDHTVFTLFHLSQCTLKSVCPLCYKRHTFLFSKLPCVTAFWPSNCHLGVSNCLLPLYKRSSQLGVDSVHPHIEGQQGIRPLPENPATLSHLAPLCVALGRQWDL